MEPIIYTTGAQTPMQAFQSALTLGSEIQRQRAAALKAKQEQAEAEAAARKQAQIAAAYEKVQKPGATAKDYMDLAMILPKDESEAVRKSYESFKAEERQAALIDSSKIFSAFKADRPDLAIQLIRQQGEAERASGNEQGATLAEQWAKMAESGPEGARAVETMFGYTIANLPGGDKAIDGVTKYTKDLRDEQEFPLIYAQRQDERAKAKSEQEKAAIDLKYAEKFAEAKLRRDTAEAITFEAKAAVAPIIETAGATTAQAGAVTAQAQAGVAGRKAEAETAKLEADARAGQIALETLSRMKNADLAKAQSEAEKAAIEAKYADPLQATQLLLAQGKTAEQQAILRTLPELKAAELAKAKSEAEVAAIEAKYADPRQAAQLLLEQNKASELQVILETLPALRQAELSQAQTKANEDIINAKYNEATLSVKLAILNAEAETKQIDLYTYKARKDAELKTAESAADVAAIEAKYADPKALADLAISQGQSNELAIKLKFLADEKEIALETARSQQQIAAVDAEFAYRSKQALLDQALADVGLTMDQADKVRIETAIAAAKEARDVETFPDEKAKLAADAKTAKADAIVAEVEAKYADKAALASLTKLGKDLELTDAQINKSIVDGKKVSAETSKILMEIELLKTNKGLTPDKSFEMEEKVRKEYNSRAAESVAMGQTYAKMESAAAMKNGVGDIALIFGFMKMLEPDSVVRESEFAQARDTTGLFESLKVIGTGLQAGDKLSDKQRAYYIGLASEYLAQSKKHEQKVKEDLGMVVRNYGLNPANVFGASSPNLTRGTKPVTGVGAPTGTFSLEGLRAFIKENNPATKAAIDTMTEAQLAESFPNGYAVYKAQNPTQAQAQAQAPNQAQSPGQTQAPPQSGARPAVEVDY